MHDKKPVYQFAELLAATESYPDSNLEHYLGSLPEAVAWDKAGQPDQGRFVEPTQRRTACAIHPGVFHTLTEGRGIGPLVAATYKGLRIVKHPTDMWLYSRLVWELQPRTILELGVYQGGVSLWFADQMSTLCREPGEVHGFELYSRLISSQAKHPLLKFHEVDLMDLSTLDPKLFENLPHPWLISEDSSTNVMPVFRFLDRYMQSGDYYVCEDETSFLPLSQVSAMMSEFEAAGFLVDSYYTDAFGYNMTSALNTWLRKS